MASAEEAVNYGKSWYLDVKRCIHRVLDQISVASMHRGVQEHIGRLMATHSILWLGYTDLEGCCEC